MAYILPCSFLLGLCLRIACYSSGENHFQDYKPAVSATNTEKHIVERQAVNRGRIGLKMN